MDATNKRPIRVLIVDDHAILRAGLRILINAQPDMEVLGEAKDSHEALQKAREMNPDVVLMDILKPKIGLETVEQLRQMCPHTRILVLTMHDDPACVRSALAAGGSGYVVKRAADSDLLAAIRAVHRGQVFVDPTLVGSLVQDLLGKKASAGPADRSSLKNLLSQREREVVELIVQRFTNREIAARLGMTEKTVKVHLRHIYEKLRITGRRELHKRFSRPTAAPLSLYFDLDEFTPTEIAEVIGYLSSYYQTIGGDKLVIDEITMLESSLISDPVGS